MRVAAIIEARMGSTRLPGKVLKGANDAPLLAHMIERVWAAQMIDHIIVATPATADNAPIWTFLKDAPPFVKVSSGPEDDVLARVLKAAKEQRVDVIVELTGDCPLIDPAIIDLCAAYYMAAYDVNTGTGVWDFVGNTHPFTWPRGMDVRVFSTQTLEKVDAEVKGDIREAYWREHVSPWMYERVDTPYRGLNLTADPNVTYPELNLSVDTQDDYRRVKGIIEALKAGNPMFTVSDAIQYLAPLPGYEMLNTNRPEIAAPWMQDVVSA